MTEELKQGDEVWVKLAVVDPVPDADGEIELNSRSYFKPGEVRKFLPEMNEAKERVVEAARRYRRAGTPDALFSVVDALEAVEKPSLEDELRTELESLVFKATDGARSEGEVAPSLQRILGIVERHKGEQS